MIAEHHEKDSSQSSGDDAVLSGRSDSPVHGTSSADAAATTEKNITKLDSRLINAPENDNDDLSRLPEHEQAIIKRQLEVPPVKVTFTSLYRYATKKDLIIIAISALCAIAAGAAVPLMTVLFCLQFITLC